MGCLLVNLSLLCVIYSAQVIKGYHPCGGGRCGLVISYCCYPFHSRHYLVRSSWSYHFYQDFGFQFRSPKWAEVQPTMSENGQMFRQLKSVPTLSGIGTPVPSTLVTDHLSRVKPQASLAIPKISDKRKFHSFFHPLEGGVWGMPEAWSKYTFNFFNNNGRRNCRQIL